MEQQKKGGISVETEHIFPVIKKWLYSEKEIFLRELVSNACDAVTKLKRLASLGQYEEDGQPYRVTVSFNKTEKTLTVSDNGIGMTAEEIERYLCHMAISGALEFIQRYEGENTEGGGQGIIGHFGLGFYSAFMVADTVEVLTTSYTGGTTRWICEDSGSYEMKDEEGGRERGSSVILHINAEGEEYLSEAKLRSVLDRYCAFMPIEIYLEDEEKEEKEVKEGEEVKSPAPVNDTQPLWLCRPSDCTDEQYNEFYRKVFNDYREPLFHLHINADYPLNFKGILYFPKIREQYESMEGKIKLYYNQVFVADNIKEVIPEYLLLLRGVLDCPELPLNVSRSYLQNNTYVTRVSAHIVKKVADKLNAMVANEREQYEKIWKDLRTFVEYGCISDRKFYDRVIGAVLFPLSNGGMTTLDEYLETAKEAHEGVVYYATDADLQSQYIAMYESEGRQVVMMPSMLDVRFAETVEQNREKTRFVRVDAEIDALKGEGESEANETLTSLFASFAEEQQKLKVEIHRLKNESVPAILNISEESRRMQEMMKMYAPDAPVMPTDETLILNDACPLIQRLAAGEFGEKNERIARQVYRLAQISAHTLTAEEMKTFLSDSYALLAEF